MSDNNQELNLDQLDQVAGGNDGTDWIHDLKNFVYRTVINVVHYDDTACLTMRKSPAGAIIQGVSWQNGDSIRVHKSYREDGWYLAYKGGIYGYVNPNNVSKS